MPPLSPLVAVMAAASASASFTATPAAMSLRGRACISEAPVKGALERQISSAEAALQRRGAVLDHAHGERAAADGNRPERHVDEVVARDGRRPLARVRAVPIIAQARM